MSMKKDGIQTRNRKLSTKNKKKKGAGPEGFSGASFMFPDMLAKGPTSAGLASSYTDGMKPYFQQFGSPYYGTNSHPGATHAGFHASSRFPPNINIVGALA